MAEGPSPHAPTPLPPAVGRAAWLPGGIALLVLLAALAAAWALASGAARPGATDPRLQRLGQAELRWTLDGETRRAQETLPYHWDREHPGRAGSASFEMVFHLDRVPAEPWGMYLPRLGNAYEVWINGMLMQRHGDLLQGNGADHAKAPHYVAITPGLLRTHNLVRINIRADVGRRAGLAAPRVGPEEVVLPQYLRDLRWRETGSIAVVILSLLVATAALGLWANQVEPHPGGRRQRPRRDRLYLYAGLAELCWMLRIGDALVANPPLPWPWWGALTVLAMGAWIWSMTLFSLEVSGWSRLRWALWLRRWLGALVLASVPAAWFALETGLPLVLTAWYALLAVGVVAFMPAFLVQAVRRGSLAYRLVALAMLVNTLVGLRDLYAFRFSDSYADNTLMRYSSVLFGLALGAIVILRFRAATAQARSLMSTMAARIAHNELELRRSFQRLEELGLERARVTERARILRDMHDGVGSHIGSAIRQLESGRSSQHEVLLTLRDSLDHLKLSIDAMHLPPGDINALLANLRYRLGTRIEASGLELQWDVDELQPVARLDDAAMRQLQFMLLEALSNVQQHAQADRLRVAAEPLGARGDGVRLRIVDNGRGFDTARATRNGLASMQARAGDIGAGLSLHSRPGHTVVEITLR